LASTAPPRDAADADADAAQRHLVFGVGGRLYACEVALVREIVPFRRCTRLPGAPPYVCGLINLRGTVVTVLDLGLRLAGKPVNRDEGAVILVERAGRLVGLGVDELRDLQVVSPAAVEAADARGAADGTGAVRGVVRVGGEVVVLLDVGSIITHALR
jgi:purine-binding chemotaxis protein CheW